MSNKAKVLVARAIFPDLLTKLEELFEVRSNQADQVLSPEGLKEALAGAEGALVTGSERIDAAALVNAKNLKIVANISVGYNNFDVSAITAAGVMATNTPDVLTDTTADFGFALLMATARRITESERWIRDGKWDKWSIVNNPLGMDLHHSTIGIIGMGRIGQDLAKRLEPFKVDIAYTGPNKKALSYAYYSNVQDLAKACDVLFLACPATPDTDKMITTEVLDSLGPSGYLINIARGSVVDENALLYALQHKKIAGAALDVFENEPNPNTAFSTLDNVLLTPHIGSATLETRIAMTKLAVDNLEAFFKQQTLPSEVNN